MTYYQPGDIVMIREDLIPNRKGYRMFIDGDPENYDNRNPIIATNNMCKAMAGKLATIRSNNGRYGIIEYGGMWTDEMFVHTPHTPLEESNIPLKSFLK